MDSQQPQRLDSVIGGDLWQFIIGNKWQATNSRPWASNKYTNSAAPREAQIERCSLLVSAPCSCRRGTGPATHQEACLGMGTRQQNDNNETQPHTCI